MVPPGSVVAGRLAISDPLWSVELLGQQLLGRSGGRHGGALILGAMPRIKRRQRVRDCLAISAQARNSRQQGLILSLPVMAALLVWMVRYRPPPQILSGRVILALFLSLAVIAAASCYYCWRVTGSRIHMPYHVNQRQYVAARLFYWQSPGPPPTYRHKRMADFYLNAQLGRFLESRSLRGFLRETALKVLQIWQFHVGPALTIPLFALPWVLRDRRFRWLSLTGAPMTALILAFVLQGMRHQREWRWDMIAVVICILLLPLQLFEWFEHSSSGEQQPGYARARVLSELSSLTCHQLAIVRYRPDRTGLGPEWVDNDVDIVNSKVLSARNMGPKENQALINYFKDRSVWLVEPDLAPRCCPPLLLTQSGVDDFNTRARGTGTEMIGVH